MYISKYQPHEHIRTIIILIWDLINYFYLLGGQYFIQINSMLHIELGKLEAVVVDLHEKYLIGPMVNTFHWNIFLFAKH